MRLNTSTIRRSLLPIIPFLLLMSGCSQTRPPHASIKGSDIMAVMDQSDAHTSMDDRLYFKKTKDKKYYSDQASSPKGHIQKTWVKIKIKTNTGQTRRFEIMSSPVLNKDFYSNGDSSPVTDVSFETANEYCLKRLDALLVNPFVFDAARSSKSINRPKGIAMEIMTPYDEDEDAEYLKDGDRLAAKEGTFVVIDWDSERYHAVTRIFRSKNATFRCMRIK